jgi:plasmid stabilization system protein ParE
MIKIIWTKRASNDLEKITKFNKEIFGAEKAFEISRNLIQVPSILKNSTIDYTKIGQIDDSFIHLKREYRKLITNYYKITFRISKENIYLIRVFDTRQNPTKNK